MPPKQKAQKTKPGSQKKRKNISPLFADNEAGTQVSDNTQKPVLTNTDTNTVYENSGLQNQNKRFHASSPEYFIFENPNYNNINSNMNTNMSYSQQPFTGQILQSPQSQLPQYAGAPPMTQTQIAPPPWAITLMEDIKNIKSKVDRIETVERTVNSINYKLSQLEVKVDSIDKRVVEVEKNCSFVSAKFDDQSKDLEAARQSIKQLTDSSNNLKKAVESLEKDRDRLNDRVVEGEFRSMRDNLIFYGIKEGGQHEDCDGLVTTFIRDRLRLDGDNMHFDRAHRLGYPKEGGGSRPVVVKFHRYKDREAVMQAATTLKTELKDSNHGVGAQIPKEWREARKSLQEVFSAEKKKGNTVRFKGDKLFVNGRQYKVPTSTSS